MTIAEVIERVIRARVGCKTEESRIIEDINRVEMNVIGYVVTGRVGDDEIKARYGNYNEETDRSRGLLVPAPYDTIYIDYCCAQIDREFEDSERYANSMTAFNAALGEFKREYWKSHRQKKRYQYFGGN
jgi:hypothetical protein